MTSVREARRILAAALAEADQPKKALEQLEAALTEPGATPDAAELYLASGRLHEALGSVAQAFDAYANAVTRAPVHAEAARAALALLAAFPDLGGGQELALEVSAAIAAAAAPAAAALAFAGRLLHRSGQLEEAAAMLERSVAGDVIDNAIVDELVDLLLEAGRLTEARGVVDRYASCGQDVQGWLLLEEQRFTEALAMAEDASGPRAAAVRLLALVGLGRSGQVLDETLDAVPAVDNIDGCFARLVALLEGRQYSAARDAAEELARLVGTEPIALVIRAQVQFEQAGSGDEQADSEDERTEADDYEAIEEARDSLHRVGKLTPGTSARVLTHRWLRVQRAVRWPDDRFGYALTEAVVALDDDPARRREAVRGCGTATTSLLQDAVLSELAAMVLDPYLDSIYEQAAAFRKAAEAFSDRGIAARARGFAERAADLAPTLEARCDLAEITLRASWDPAVDEPTRIQHLETALRVLVGDGSLPRHADSSPGYLRGLLLSRLAEICGGDGGWQSLPYLASAVLATDDAYRWANLATALSACTARLSAYACADRSRALAPGDTYTRDIYLSAEVFHLADPDLTAQAITGLGEDDDAPDRYGFIKLVAAALNGQRAEVQALLPTAEVQAQEPWERWTVLQSRMLYATPPSDAELAELAAEMEQTPNDNDMDGAADIWCFLGQPEAAETAIDRASRAPKRVVQQLLPRLRAQAALLRDPSGPGEAAWAALIGTELSPTRLLDHLNVSLPLLGERQPALAPVTERLRDVARSRLRELELAPPSMSAEFAQLTDPTERAALTGQLMELIQLELAGERGTLADRAAGLDQAVTAADGDDDFLTVALRTARAGIASRVFANVGDRLLQRSLNEEEVRQWADRLDRLGDSLGEQETRRVRVAVWWAARDSAQRTGYRAAISDDASAPVAAGLLAERFAALAGTGDMTGAAEAYLAGVEFAAEPPFSDLAAAALPAVAAYQDLVRALDRIGLGADGRPGLGAAVARTRDRLLPRVEELLGLRTLGSGAELPVVAPIRVPLGSGLVPFVDPSQDGNVFIGELIPQMKERVFAATGVRLPGLKLRGENDIAADRFAVEIDDNPVGGGTVPVDGEYLVRPAEPADFAAAAAAADAEHGPFLSRFHPLTGEPNAWTIAARDSTDQAAAAGEAGTPLRQPQLLMYAIEQVLRARLADLIGVQETSELVNEWAASADLDLVTTVLPDQDARVALTWVLQDLLRERLSIANWQQILRAIRDAGGLQIPTRTLVDSIRPLLSPGIAAAGPWPQAVVPTELAQAVVDGERQGARRFAVARHELLTWVRARVAADGPVLNLVVGSESARAAVADIIRGESASIEIMRDESAAVESIDAEPSQATEVSS